MKKYLFVLLAVISLISCEDTEINDVALQAKVDDRFYESNDARAVLNEDGTVTIQGFTDNESITLRISQLDERNFQIGEGLPNSAIYEDMGGNIYTTNPDGEGVVTISELNETNKTLSGTFKFNAFLPGIDTIYVSKGTLYNISYAGGTIQDPTNAGNFIAKVDNNPFLPIVVSARDTGNKILISGSTANATIAVSLPQEVEVGEYLIPRSGFTAKYQDATGPETTSEGIITITEHNLGQKTLKGTFSFLTERTEITEGQFDIIYTD